MPGPDFALRWQRHPRDVPPPPLPPMPPPSPVMLRFDRDGAVIDFPAPVLAPDAQRWAATCWPDATQPGGWARAMWWDVRYGRPGFQPVALEYSDIVEFGADLPHGNGRRAVLIPVRWYGIMLSRSRFELVVHGPHPSADAAAQVARDLRSALAYRLIGQIELPPPRRPAGRRPLYLQPQAQDFLPAPQRAR